MALQPSKRVPIVLLIGAGSRVGPFLQKVRQKKIPVELIVVVSHKALLPDKSGQKTIDVPGIALAKKLKFRTEYFNLIQMRNAAEKVALKKEEKFDEEKFREEFYFPVLAAFLKQQYPVEPEVIFMNGWDLVLPKSFLDFFPVFNFHPSLLPDNPNDKTVKLSDGSTIPVLIGEETDVFNKALKLKLPAIGVTLHKAQVVADVGGSVVEKIEIPILPKDNYDTLRKRHIKVESQFMIDAISRWATNNLG